MIDLTALNLCHKYFPCFTYEVKHHQGVIQAIKGLLRITYYIEYHFYMYEYGEQYGIDIWYYLDPNDVDEDPKTIIEAIGDTPDEALRLAKLNVNNLVIGVSKLAELDKKY